MKKRKNKKADLKKAVLVCLGNIEVGLKAANERLIKLEYAFRILEREAAYAEVREVRIAIGGANGDLAWVLSQLRPKKRSK